VWIDELHPQVRQRIVVRASNAQQAAEILNKIMKKYSGVWPIKNIEGHNITGFLYEGDATVWPHPPMGALGAPSNLEKEFAVSSKHIDFYLSHDRRRQHTLSSWYV
jgi:hypothetical protein